MALVALVWGAPSLARAHIRLDVPKARTTPNLKTGPCGASTAGTPQEIAGWTAGATVTIEYTETINHPSHYRVALSREGESAFVDPIDADDKTTDGNELLDGIADLDEGNNRSGTIEVVLPNEPCENCVLQLMQIMYDKPAMPFYYQCADVVIAPGAGNTGSGGGANEGVGGSDGSGGDVGSGGTEASGGAVGASDGGSSSVGGGTLGVGGSLASTGGSSTSSVGGAIGVGGSASGVGGDMGEDDGPDSTSAGGCSLGNTPRGMSAWGLLGLVAFGALGARRRVRG